MYENSDGTGSVSGGYGYKNDVGETVETRWNAGAQGFVPAGAHLQGLEVSVSRDTLGTHVFICTFLSHLFAPFYHSSDVFF